MAVKRPYLLNVETYSSSRGYIQNNIVIVEA